MLVARDNIKNKVIRLCSHRAYYFDEDGIYRSVSDKEALKMDMPNIGTRLNGECFLLTWDVYTDINVYNKNYVRMAISKLKEGDSLKTFEEYLSTVKSKKHLKPEGLDRFITRIDKPVFVRTPENQNEETFDFIYVHLNLIINWDEDKAEYIKKNVKEIDQRVLEMLEADMEMKRYGIPIGFLKLSRRVLKDKRRILEYLFEIREV